ncbi:SGNH/GDSL hydrolase family protein [Alsobacter metallidurans]|nr:SGNH/GDSL hydrolase family protein [Alsobacter metallidurans]
MEPFGSEAATRRSRRAGLGAALAAAALAAALLLGGASARAEVSPRCRVPDVYLSMAADLKRTERLIDRATPVRVMVLGPEIGGAAMPERRRARLHQELARRLPATNFEFVDDSAPSGLVEDDFNAIRSAAARVEPDLVIWQVGGADALASTDAEEFGKRLADAAKWMKERNIDLILVDPPFVPRVRHEQLYWRIVGKIREVTDRARLNLFQRYAAMQFLDFERQKLKEEPTDANSRRVCMAELVAEAIAKAATR